MSQEDTQESQDSIKEVDSTGNSTGPRVQIKQDHEDAKDDAQSDAPEADDERDDSPLGDFDPDRAKAKIRKQNSELKALRDRTKQAEEKAESAEEAGKRAEDLTQENLRLSVALDLGLPLTLAKRLNGSTKEELLADADELLKLVEKKSPPTTRPQERLRGGSDPTVEPEETDLDKLSSRMFRR